MLKKYLKKKWFIPTLLLLLIIPSLFFFLKPGIYWNMHDDMQIIRQLDFEKCIKDGQIPCRWVPDLGYQYGYPLFNYYPPLPYIIGQIWRTLGFSFINTIKLTAALQIITTAYFMYLLGKSLTNRIGGLLGSVFYTYAPYHAVNIYVRGAMNEAWAATFFPLVLYFLRRSIIEKKISLYIGLAISFSAILLSHNPMALIFVPIMLLWALYWIFHTGQLKNLKLYLHLFLSGLLSFGLAAFLTLPVLFETKLVQVETMFSGYYNYSVHFANLYQLFISSFWGDGPSVWGPEDKMSFMIGYLHWLIPLFLSLFLVFKFIKSRKKINILPVLIFLTGLFYAFMSHERSTFIWMILKPIQNVQFPWRFLNPTIFLMSLSTVFLVKLIKNKVIIFSLIIAIILLNIRYFYPIHSGPISDSQKLSGESWRLLTTASIYDYLPKTAPTAAKAPAKEFVDQVIPADTQYQLSGQKKGSDWLFTNIDLASEADVILPVLAFPDFRLFDFGKQINYSIDSQLGRISTHLSAGNHQLYLKLYNTPVRTVANLISLISWTLVILYFSKLLWQRIFKA